MRPSIRWPYLAYAAPGLAAASVAPPVTAILPSLYAKHAALSLTAVGTLFLVMRIFDAVTDPLIGYLSDRTRSRIGARKPWILAGGSLVALSVYFLFQIPADAGIGYFGFWAVAYHLAWGSEISKDYDARATVFAYRSVVEGVGSMLYTLVPLALFYFGVIAATNYTPQVFQWLAHAVLVLFPVMLGIAVWAAPEGELESQSRPDLRGAYQGIAQNAPLRRFLSAYLAVGAATGVFAALAFPFIDVYLGIGNKVPVILLTSAVAALVSQPFWVRMVGLFGKHRTWAWGWIANALALTPLVLVEPGPDAVVPVLVAFALYGFTSGVSTVAPYALLADIVDYEILKRGVDRAGSYYAYVLFIAKSIGSVGGLTFIFLGAVFGYELANGAKNTDLANLGMVLCFCILPGLIQLLAIPLIWNFPIDRRRHAIIRRRLAQRRERVERSDQPEGLTPLPEATG
jgi:glycoside/pentoside/hexuronide:cation symporter, GPH family